MHDIPTAEFKGKSTPHDTSCQVVATTAVSVVRRDACSKRERFSGRLPPDIDPGIANENEAAFCTDAIGIMIVQNGVVVRGNGKLGQMYGEEPAHLVGMSLERFFPTLGDRHDDTSGVMDLIQSGEVFTGESYALREDGTILWVKASARALDASGAYPSSIWFLTDVTEGKRTELSLRKSRVNEQSLIAKTHELEAVIAQLRAQLDDLTETERQMSYLVHHDPLTGLANRTLLIDRLSHAIALAQRDRSGVVVMFIDLDDFKRINDNLGHRAGDKLLSEVASRLRRAVRKSDLVARIGGDEFVIMMKRVAGKKDADAIARKIQDVLSVPIEVHGQEVLAKASIGISCFPEHGCEIASLLHHADVAMYHAKRNKDGKGMMIFDESMRAQGVAGESGRFD